MPYYLILEIIAAGNDCCSMVLAQVNYDLLDTYPGGPYKSRGGSIKKTRFAAEEEEEDEENEEGQVQHT